MTRPLEINDPREDLATTIMDQWFNLNTERNVWLSKTTDARNYVTGADTNATEVGQLEWKNKTTIPKLTQLVDGLQSYYMSAIMPNDEWFIWEGRDIEDQNKANLIESYMRTKLRMSGFRTEMEKIIKDWLIYGSCFAGVTWVKEFTKSAVTGEEIVNYIGPKMFRISPLDCAVDPRAATFEDTPFITRKMVSLQDIKEHNEKVTGPKYDEKVVDEVISLRAGGPAKQDYVDFFRESGMIVDGFNSIDEYVDSGLVELVTFAGDIYVQSTGEVLKNRIVTIVDGTWILVNEENPAWNGKKPFAMSTWRQLPDNLYGQSPIDNLVGMQYRCDHLENLKADVFDQIAHPIVIIKGDETEPFEYGPGAKIYVPTDGDVNVVQPPAGVLNADNQIATYHAYMEQMAGVPREAMGFRTPGEKTAFEVNVLTQGADRQFIDKTNHLEETFIQPMLNLMYELMIRNMDMTDIARTFNDDTRALALLEITKEDVVADGNLRAVGSKHFEKRNKRIQELKTLLELSATTGVGMHISGLGAAQMLSEELGWDKYNVVVPFAAIKEQAAAQLQQQIAAQQLQQATGGEAPIEAE